MITFKKLQVVAEAKCKCGAPCEKGEKMCAKCMKEKKKKEMSAEKCKCGAPLKHPKEIASGECFKCMEKHSGKEESKLKVEASMHSMFEHLKLHHQYGKMAHGIKHPSLAGVKMHYHSVSKNHMKMARNMAKEHKMAPEAFKMHNEKAKTWING